MHERYANYKILERHAPGISRSVKFCRKPYKIELNAVYAEIVINIKYLMNMRKHEI